MGRTAALRHEHDLAMAIADNLRAMAERYRCRDDALPIATELARLLHVLRLHLAEEDLRLYPSMIASGDWQAAKVARRFQAEMGGLAEIIEGFMQRWCSSSIIALDIDVFRRDLDRLSGALVRRIDRENQFLYPLAERLGDASSDAARRVA